MSTTRGSTTRGSITGREMAQGMAAGVVATAAYTALSSWLRDRGPARPSVQPLDVASTYAGTAAGGGGRGLNAVLHWGYGAWGGAVRAVLVHRGVRGLRGELAHLAVFWLPWRLAVAGSGRRTEPRALALELVKHLVYVLVAGLTHRALEDSRER